MPQASLVDGLSARKAVLYVVALMGQSWTVHRHLCSLPSALAPRNALSELATICGDGAEGGPGSGGAAGRGRIRRGPPGGRIELV